MELILRKTAADHILIDGLDDLPIVSDSLENALTEEVLNEIQMIFKTKNSISLTIQ